MKPWIDLLDSLLPQPLLFWFVVVVLATYRVSSIMVYEKIAAPFRRFLGVIEKGDKVLYPDTFWGKLISCFRCTSVWVAVGCVILFLILPILLLPFAVSALAVALNEIVFAE